LEATRGRVPLAWSRKHQLAEALSTGTRLGSYTILGSIGAGAMGEVHRAHDTKLDRHVALKILPAAFAQDPDRLARFTREAKVPTLNHPNICTIHDFGETEDREPFIILEVLEGSVRRAGTRIRVMAQLVEAKDGAHLWSQRYDRELTDVFAVQAKWRRQSPEPCR